MVIASSGGGGDAAALSTDTTAFVGKALTVCALELPESGKSTGIDMGLLSAFGCKLSKHKHHLLYDVNGIVDEFGFALVLFEGKPVGMHLAMANTLIDHLERELDAQMDEVAESIASAADHPAQLGVALLCHMFMQ